MDKEFDVRLVGLMQPTITYDDGTLMGPEGLIAYCARVSSNNQENPEYSKLLRYCAEKEHWSVFDMGSAIFEIITSRGVSPQILRHWSFKFQEFSQRYQAVDESGIVIYAARRQDEKNRQNSIEDISNDIQQEFKDRQQENWKHCYENYKWALEQGIAKECARTLLPLGTSTRLFMHGTIRSWATYLKVRNHEGAQKEHRIIAQQIQTILAEKFPIVAQAFDWN